MKKIWIRCSILPGSRLSMLLSQAPTTTLQKLILSRKISDRGMKTGVSKLNQMLIGHNLGISQIQMDILKIVNFKKVYLIIKISTIQAQVLMMILAMLMRTPTGWTGLTSLIELGKMWLHTNLLKGHLFTIIPKVSHQQVHLSMIRILFNHNLVEHIHIHAWIPTKRARSRVNQWPSTHKTTSSSTISRSISHQTVEQDPIINIETVTKESSRRKLGHQLKKPESTLCPLNSNNITTKRSKRLPMKLPRECISTRRSMNASWKSWGINITLNRPDRRWKSAHLVLRFLNKIEMELRDQERALQGSITSQETKNNSRRRSKTGSTNNLLSRTDTWRSREAKDWWVQTVEE